MQTFRFGEAPLRRSAVNFGRSARGFRRMKEPIRHSAVFGEHFTLRQNTSDVGNVHHEFEVNL